LDAGCVWNLFERRKWSRGIMNTGILEVFVLKKLLLRGRLEAAELGVGKMLMSKDKVESLG
jgi:hypothetical protein